MIKIRPWLTVVALACAFRARGAEQIFAASGDANPLQYIGAGARPAALGSAFTAVSGDLSSLYFNPAGLGGLKGSHAGLHHHNWLGGITQESLSFGIGGKLASFGLSGDLVNYGDFEGTDEQGNPVASFSPMDFTLGFNLAKAFDSGLAIGFRARGTQQSIKDAGQLSTAGDIGAIWALRGSPFSLGITYANFGPAVNGNAPSAAIRLGLSSRLDLGEQYGLLFLLSGSGLNNGGELIQAGAELTMTKYLAARVGYQASFMDQEFDGFSGLTAGLGLKYGVFALDYAFLPYGRIGNSQRLSLNIDFFSGYEAPSQKAPESRKQAAPNSGQVFGAEDKGAAKSQPRPAEKSVEMIFELATPGAPNGPIAPAGPSEAELKAAVRKNPRNAQALDALGHYYYKARNRPAMIETFDKLLELQPRNAELRTWLKKVKGME